MARCLLRFVAITLVVFVPRLVHAQETAAWRAGLAKVTITPEKLMWMSGYGARTKPAEGKLTELWAKALVVEDAAGQRGVLVTLDLVGIDREVSLKICQQLSDKYKLPRESIILSLSHTHCGPVVGSNLASMYFLDDTQQQLVREYTEYLPRRIDQAVDAALKSLAPARLRWGIGQAGFAVNRRNNKEADVPKLREMGALKGPVDHDVPVLEVRDAKGTVRGLVFGYACHATVLSFQQWCGDYPGFAMIELEKTYPGAVAMFFAGCGADQNPLPRRTVTLAQEYGVQLARAVEELVKKGPMKELSAKDGAPSSRGLRAVYAEIPLPLAELPTRDKLAEEASSTNKYVASRAKMLLARLQKGEKLAARYPYPVQVWRLGPELVWVTLGGEVVVDYSLRLKKELGPDATWVMGYANDVMAYIPSLRVLKEGGYEGGGSMLYYGLPTVWAPAVEETLVAAVHAQVVRVRAGKSAK